jgi:hypothetical protein
LESTKAAPGGYNNGENGVAAKRLECRSGDPLVKSLPDLASNLPDIAAGKRMLARVIRKRDTPGPVAAWRAAPETALEALFLGEKTAYIEVLLPLARSGRTVERGNLRRLYQLFTFMEMPHEERVEILAALHTRLRLTPQSLPYFANQEVRRSLLAEAVAMGAVSGSKEAKDYIAGLATHLNLKAGEAGKWTQFFEKLTDLENRVAATLGKKGHIVRMDARKLEIFKKAVASVGVPGAVLFPLGTVGLSVEGITTGLVALGGGFLLPASVAMVTGLGVAVALGVSSKKILDMVIPTTDADRISIDIEKLNADATEITKVLDDATGGDPNRKKLEEAHAKISEIIKKIVPLSDAERAKLEAAFAHARILGDRYLDYLATDRDALENRNHVGADEVAALLELDTPAIR